jgi:hypothetical protein
MQSRSLRGGLVQIAVETVIDAPPAAVFAVAANIVVWPQFMSGIRNVEILTPGPIASGTRFRETRIMLGRTAAEEMTIAEFQSPNRLLLTAFNHGTDYTVDHTFTTAGRGTRLSLRFEGRPVTLLSRLLSPLGRLFAGSVRKQIEKDVADLKREAERRHAAAR